MQCHNRDFVVPAITDRYIDYQRACDEKHVKKLGHSSFLAARSALATRDSKRKSAVDSIVGGLVNDTIADLHRLVETFVPAEYRPKYDAHIEVVQYFLKTVYMDSHKKMSSEAYIVLYSV